MYLTCFRHILWRLFFASTFSSRGYVYIDIRVYIDIVQQSLSCLRGHVWLYVLTMRKMHWYTFKMPSNKVPLSLSLVRQLLDRRKGRKTSNRPMHKTPNNQQQKNPHTTTTKRHQNWQTLKMYSHETLYLSVCRFGSVCMLFLALFWNETAEGIAVPFRLYPHSVEMKMSTISIDRYVIQRAVVYYAENAKCSFISLYKNIHSQSGEMVGSSAERERAHTHTPESVE